jgi:hypothetical protein
VLVYQYACDGGVTDYRYTRLSNQRCFDPEPNVDDRCGG